MAKLLHKKRNRSHFSKDEFYLDSHDEEKVLMFVTGLVLGIGLMSTVLGIFVYGGIVLIVVAITLIYVEQRIKARERMEFRQR